MREVSGPPIDRLLAPLREFSDRSASSGVLLMIAALAALIWANSPAANTYERLWSVPLTIGVDDVAISKPLMVWINDGLMALFFLVVGLEIKREALVGELASPRRAALPIAAAVGGALLPAGIFLAIVGDGDAARGWGVPMATDIAFALGILALLGRRVPIGLKVFVTAFAIVDDLLAVLVIALFYTADLIAPALIASAVIVALLVLANRLGVRRPLAYGLLGLALWLTLLQSGVHPAIAGVILAMTVPARIRVNSSSFAERAGQLLEEVDLRGDRIPVEERHAALWELESLTEQAQAPMLRLEHALQPWVAFFIVPLFALANAGVSLGADIRSLGGDPIVAGVFFGLVLGKQAGIVVASWLVVRLGLAALPDGVSWWQIYGAACLGGIGFTMSLFIGDLAYGPGPELALAKVGILAASMVAGLAGFGVLRLLARPVAVP